MCTKAFSKPRALSRPVTYVADRIETIEIAPLGRDKGVVYSDVWSNPRYFISAYFVDINKCNLPFDDRCLTVADKHHWKHSNMWFID
jgi:hypothetical protein